MTYSQALKNVKEMFETAGIEEAATDSRLLMDHVCGGREFYLLHAAEEMPEAMREKYFSLAKKRSGRIPLQHITGEQDFMGFYISVNEHVLIPRQDTEVLGEEAVRLIADLSGGVVPHNIRLDSAGEMSGEGAPQVGRNAAPHVLDLCTGSGALAVALAALCPNARVFASDISEEALAVAEKNAEKNHADVTFYHSDLFENIDGKFDVIVSNPPYIQTAVIDTLAPEVRDHEPRLALDGGEDGLVFYRKIIAESRKHLTRHGYLMMEIGCDEAYAVKDLMTKNGFDSVRAIKDLAGLDRVVKGRRK